MSTVSCLRSANTELEFLTAQYANAFALVAPLITDSNVGIEGLTSRDSHIKKWESFAMTSLGKSLHCSQ